MKRFFKLIVIIIISYLGISTAQAQKIIGMSDPNMRVDSIKLSIYDVAKQRVFYTYKYVFHPDYPDYKKEYLYFLQIGDKYNVFNDYNKFRADSVGNTYARKNLPAMQYINTMINIGRHADRNESKVLINKQRDTIAVQRSIFGDEYQYTEHASKPTWKEIDGDTIIEGYTCKKATTTLYGRNWTAWYALEINMPYGPYKFGGLPGLILYITDTENNFEFSMCGLTNVEFYDPIYLYANNTHSTREQVRQIDRNYHSDPAKVLEGSGAMVSGETQVTIPSIPYNPIERE